MSIAALPGHKRQLGPPPKADVRSGRGLATDQLLVLAALAAAAVGHGGYYRRASEVCAILLTVAAVTTLSRRHLSGVRPVWPALAGLGALAVATTATAGMDGRAGGAAGPVALIIGLAVVMVVVAGSSPSERRTMADAILALGAFLALTGWIGVVFRVNGLAQLADGLWRAATTITYSNAAAALLAMLALWALARAVTRKDRAGAVATVLIIGGMGSTLSRAGLAGFAVGLIVLALVIGFGTLLRRTLPLLFGGALVTAGLGPGMAAGGPSRPVWAVLGSAGPRSGVTAIDPAHGPKHRQGHRPRRCCATHPPSGLSARRFRFRVHLIVRTVGQADR